MLKNKISYYFWRVAAGVSIGLILMFARTNFAHALSWDLQLVGESQIFNGGNSGNHVKNSSLNNPNGYISFDFDTNFTNSNNAELGVLTLGSIVYSQEYSNYIVQNGTYVDQSYWVVNNFVYRISLVSTSGPWSTCELQNNFVVCPLNNGITYKQIRIYFRGVSGLTGNINIMFNTTIQFFNSSTKIISSNSEKTAQNTKETAQNTKKIADEISDNSNPSIDVSGMSGVQGLLPAGPLDSLLALPVNLLNILVNATSGTCEPFTFTFVFDTEWQLPCFDTFWNQVPSTLLLFMSDLPAVYLFIKWAKSIYKRVERAVSFESSVDDEWGGV